MHARLKLLTCAAVSVAIRTEAACRYELTVIQGGPDCGTFPASPTLGHDINESGQVVGQYTVCALGTTEAFVWDGGPDVITLPRTPGITNAAAYDINDAGLIIGTMLLTASPDRAFLYDGSQFINLGTMPGGNKSKGRAINSRGQIVGVWGNSVIGNPGLAAFLWQEGVMIDLNAELGTPNSEAHDINDAGQITGWMGVSLLQNGEAYIWEDGEVTALGHLPKSSFTTGYGINEVGQVVGQAVIGSLPEISSRAVLWDNGQMINLRVLSGFQSSAASDINDVGQIVGSAWDVDGNPNIEAAFIWQNGIITDLNDLIPPGKGITVAIATAINNAGQITGWARTADLDTVAVLLTPIDQPLGDLDIDCRVGMWDLFIMFGQWANAESAADLNGDGTVNSHDLVILFANWNP